MVAFRFILVLAALWLTGLGVAFVATRDRKYVRWAWRSVQVVVILFAAFGLIYLLERLFLVA